MFCTFEHSCQFHSNFHLLKSILVMIVLMHTGIAKSNPTTPPARALAFKRAQSLDNGISVSWLEQTWNKDILTQNGLKTTDLLLLKKLGFKSIRLPVAFEYFENKHIP